MKKDLTVEEEVLMCYINLHLADFVGNPHSTMFGGKIHENLVVIDVMPFPVDIVKSVYKHLKKTYSNKIKRADNTWDDQCKPSHYIYFWV